MRKGNYAVYQGTEFRAVRLKDANRILLTSPSPIDGFEQIDQHRYVKEVSSHDIEKAFSVRTICTYNNHSFEVTAEQEGRLHLLYLGGSALVAEQLGLDQVERGVYEITAGREEVHDVREEQRPIWGRP
jgi:hypothetical protein